jgi:DNA-binding winged helix-turn-helix (wHTH) protein
MSATYFFSGAVLDEARFELRRHGARVAVQPKVLRLLIYLARHRERVVPADELFAALWQGETVCRGSLKRAVRLARQALGDDGAQQVSIRTVRTYGYQLVAPVARVPAAARPASLPIARTFFASAAQ